MTPRATALRDHDDPSDSVVFSQRDDAWSEVAALATSQYRLRLGGSFRSAWMATLCTGLADRRLSIQTAHARRAPGVGWRAELIFLSLPGAIDPLNVPYADLARAHVEQAPLPLRLDGCSVEPTRDHGGTLLLKLEADDSLGMLGSLLASLATLMLFPVEMHIETRHGRAFDTFWLAGMTGTEPSETAYHALQRMRQRWLLPPPT